MLVAFPLENDRRCMSLDLPGILLLRRQKRGQQWQSAAEMIIVRKLIGNNIPAVCMKI